MNMESHEYFKRRERVERAASKNAASSQARRIHQELAQSYAEMAQQFGPLSSPRNGGFASV